MAKKKVLGRPKGREKKALNIYLPIEMIAELRQTAKDEQRNISVIIERALSNPSR